MRVIKKKVVKSRSQLNKMASKRGAKITDSAGNKLGAPKKAVSKVPEKIKKKEPPPGPDKGAELLAEKIDKMSDRLAFIMSSVTNQVKKIKLESPEPITEWLIEFEERDENGFAKQVRLSAPKQAAPKRLDS